MNDPAIFEKLQSIESILLEQKDRFLSLADAAKYLNISVSFLYKLVGAKAIPFFKPNGKLIYFKESDLKDWILNGASLTNSKGE